MSEGAGVKTEPQASMFVSKASRAEVATGSHHASGYRLARVEAAP